MSVPGDAAITYDSGMQDYLVAGETRTFALGNRGPIRFTDDGNLHPDITEAYWRCGFYVLEGVLGATELAEIEVDVLDILDRLPSAEGSPVDRQGRPALALDCEATTLFWSRPLADTSGGHRPFKMIEPTAAANAPEEIVYLMLGTLQFSEALLRTYGHPDLLRVAAAINGPDFVPFNEALIIKEPGLGASFAWHQDGKTHWDSEDWDEGIHGFCFMGQLYGSTAANGVWIVPGSHKRGKIDIKALVAEAGSERLPDAVPVICAPGDVVITNFQSLHGSFANTSQDCRVTVNMGFHRRASVLGVQGNHRHAAPAVYDEDHIAIRSRLIGYAIDARRRHFPHETPFDYAPYRGSSDIPVWDEKVMSSLKDYNLRDMSI